ncbi:H+ transporting two-sector ATPase [Naegleria gruberi]|uniref:H+ transporting two-sector ATPase n=1 Tax=Naegleria gruberi TaxID=5762 RepID=D2VM83_NAEGR|nr:H+ transporting two-sector ATPase [Naegleria gruberi]EFC41944.1 H+ transporting two-sector ATPase [Naegleria gruberi]|eukprot:XP_002674688.1 H+ transporting two-sector ATPase [Naegleria gruberi strain NEG-M]
MSLVVYRLENSQAVSEKKHQIFEKTLNNTNDEKTNSGNNEDRTKSTVLDLRTCTQVAQTSSLLGMLENLKKLSLTSQVAIESITREADKTFERVYQVHEKVIILTEKVNRIKEFYDNSQFEEIQRKQVIQRVDYKEPEQGRFNSETIPYGWFEQYQKCEDMPNFRIVDEYLLKPPYLQSYYKNYSNPDGLFSTWKDTFVRHLRNEQQKERELHNQTQSSQTQSIIFLKKKHSVGDVIVPEKRVKKVIPVWKKYDKNNGSKVTLQQEGTIFENIQQITISENQNQSLSRTRSSVLRSAGSQKKIDNSVLSPEEPKIKSPMEEKMKTLLKKTRSQNNTLEAVTTQKLPEIQPNQNTLTPDYSPESKVIEIAPSSEQVNQPVSIIPPVPNIPPPPVNIVPVAKPVDLKPIVPPVPKTQPVPPSINISLSQSLVNSATAISGKAMLKPTSPREQTAKNDAVADLLEGIRNGIKLSKASERVLAEKPAAKQSFDVFSVLKEKFKFANAEMSTDSFCPSASGTFTEDW